MEPPMPSAGWSPATATCLNHPGTPAAGPCAECSRPFCTNCLVPVGGRMLCEACKNTSLREYQRRGGEAARLAADAFKYSLVGILCFGIILEPIALFKGIQALRAYAQEADQADRWKAITAVVIGSIMLSIWVLAIAVNLLAPQPGRR